MKQKLLSLTKEDFEIQTFRAGGKGGQSQNKLETGVRIIHKETGLSAESRQERSQYANKKLAFEKLTTKSDFLNWLKIESMRMAKILPSEQEIKNKVERMIQEDNLKIEVRKNGKWINEK